MSETTANPRFQSAARAAGPLAFVLLLFFGPADLSPEGRKTLAGGAWMIVWWITECVPILATSLLPLALFPLLGIASSRDAAAPYANDLVFLFMAGFILAAALEHWESHARVAYRMVLTIGLSGRRVVLGVMLATGFISMWISNTATAAMMYPIAMAIGALFAANREGDNTRTALMLGVAYAASIGGMATVIGTPPNLVVAGAIRELTGRSISFVEFMALGLPIALILLPVCWILLTFVVFPGRAKIGGDAGNLLRARLTGLGPVRGGEARVLAIFFATALAWFLRERKEFGGFSMPGLADLFPKISDASIGVTAAVLLFVVTGQAKDGSRRPLITWREAKNIPWNVLVFFGGGLALAQAIETHGLTIWMGSGLDRLKDFPPVAIYLGLAVTVLVLSELASNLAVAAMTMPIAAALGASVGQPAMVLMLVAGFAASTGFALPVATPPNAIVFGSGQITVRQMARAGVLLDIVAVGVIVAVIYFLAPLVLG
ncbi:MAG: SLC13/DASS family transporter [Gemmatimonadales bacterium]|nr:SLC13/DASS family transporter [Gemmatimonadales bacterium]